MLKKIGSLMSKLKLRNLKPITARRYAKWQSVKRGKKIAIIASFVLVLTGSIVGINYLNRAKADWQGTTTWSTKDNFENNTADSTTGFEGTPTIRTNIDTASTPGSIRVTPTDYPVAVDNGGSNTLVAMNSGKLIAIGDNANGQLGLGATAAINNWTDVSAVSNVGSVVMSVENSFIIKKNGELWGTGKNSNGELGLGNATKTTSWANTGLTNVSKVAVNTYHAIALKNDGTVWVTGNNDGKQLGTIASRNTWAQVTNNFGASAVVGVTASKYASFVIQADGSVWETGSVYGGSGYTDWTKIVAISGIIKLVSLKSQNGAWWEDGVLALKSDGTLYAQGKNYAGVLGMGAGDVIGTWTTTATGVSDMVMGGEHSLYKKSGNGGVYATGYAAASSNRLFNLASRTTWGKINFVAGDSSINIISAGLGASYIITDINRLYITGNYALSGVGSLTDYISNPLFFSTGSLSGLKVDAGVGKKTKWTGVSYNASGNLGQYYNVYFRTGESTDELGTADWINLGSSGGNPGVVSRFIELRIDMVGYGSVADTAAINDISLAYNSDTYAPTNPTASLIGSDGLVKVTGDTAYGNAGVLSFGLNGAMDEENGSGIPNYWLYFGTDPTADPQNSFGGNCGPLRDRYLYYYGGGETFSTNYQGGWTGNGLNYDCNNYGYFNAGQADGTYYLRVQTADYAGNISDAATIFTYTFDTVKPTAPSSLSVSPFGWSSTDNFTFKWGAGSDSTSGISNYEYKINGTAGDGAWSSSHLTASANVLSVSLSGADGVQSGANVFYVRSLDNAGNISTVKEIPFYYTGAAPTAPTVLTVDPQSSEVNSFTFTWKAPDPANSPYKGDIIGYRYSFTGKPADSGDTTFINTTNLNNLPASVTYDEATGIFTLSNLAAATQQGINNAFYIVAVGSDGNSGELVSYSDANIAMVNFGCYTTAPDAPLDVKLFDTSNKDSQAYSVAIKWTEPTNKGVGFAGYNIYRSTDGINFTQIGTSTSISFIDFGSQGSPLLSIKYYYKVLSRDNSGNISLTPTSIPSIIPTGTYSAPPPLDNNYGIKTVIGVSTASFSWKTEASDHTASTFVDIGEAQIPESCDVKAEFGFNDLSMTNDHKIKATGLKPDTTYNYRIRWFDRDGNCGKSDNLTFKTKPLPRITSMEIQDVRLYTAVLSWSTSEPAVVDLLYGRTTNYSEEVKNVSGGATTLHTIRLDGLDHSSTYHFAIRITDVDGSAILSDDYSFDTQQYPKLSNVRFQPMADQSTATFKVTWDSNVPTTSVVEFQPEGGKVQEAVKT
ncbi:MAG: fibronectin type III domain-containing protein, partial [Candidatus Saccharibacteria bacterium]